MFFPEASRKLTMRLSFEEKTFSVIMVVGCCSQRVRNSGMEGQLKDLRLMGS